MNICENINRIKEELAAAAIRVSRDPAEIELLAVTKTWPAEIVREAVDAPHLLFGENKIQEASIKIPLLPANARWHLIGNLQKNKIRKALPLFPVIHSIDSLEVAQQVDRIAAELGLFPEIYLQVNVAAEASKHGFSPENLHRELDKLLKLERLHVLGLMIIPPFDPDPEKSRPSFAKLRELRDELQRSSGTPLPGLSMGMSHDYITGVEEGATIVRVGSAIFGKRQTPKKTNAG